MPHDADEDMCVNLKSNSFSIQVDESRDFTNKGYVAAFVRFANDDEIQKNLFCCKEMSEKSKERAIFNIVYSYLETIGLSRESCVLMVPHHWLAPSEISTSQYTVRFTERCWFQEQLKIK
jgi:hypothetical protein